MKESRGSKMQRLTYEFNQTLQNVKSAREALVRAEMESADAYEELEIQKMYL